MPVAITCDSCSAKIKAGDHLIGKSIKCPKCGDRIAVAEPKAPQVAPVSAKPTAPAPKPAKQPVADNRSAQAFEEIDVEGARISRGFKTALLDRLDSGERVLRIDRPSASIHLVRSVFPTFLVLAVSGGILYLGFEHAKQIGYGFVILGFLVMLLGLSIPLVAVARKGFSLYVVTDRRAIVLERKLFGLQQTDYLPKDLGNVRVSGSWFVRGGGSLIFRTEEVFNWMSLIGNSKNAGTPYDNRYKTIYYGFLNIDGVKDAERLLREALLDPAASRRKKGN
jgi:DNA-directed RNA polymerase subunit RPC12/RpoP